MGTIEDFLQWDLRIGKILEVADHPNADRLYVLKVDLGEKTVQVVAGIRKYYQPDQLIGKLVTVVANLEPKLLRGVESHGMVLVAKTADQSALYILTPEKEIVPGSKVG